MTASCFTSKAAPLSFGPGLWVLDQCPATATGCGNWLISTSGSETATTWTVGGGVEWAFAPNWSVKGEYMFIGLKNNHEFQTNGIATTSSGAVVSGGPFVFNDSFGGILKHREDWCEL